MGEESDHVHIVALCDALQVGLGQGAGAGVGCCGSEGGRVMVVVV
jgi:hypothetical protein